MTVPASVVMGAGLRGVYLYEIDPTTGYVKPGTMAAPYAGLHVQGARVVNINDPEPRKVTHVGEDRALGLTVLPATEFVSGELRTSKRNRTLDAILTGTAEITLGEMKLFGVGTDKRGYEPQVVLWAYSTTQDSDEASAASGTQLWDGLLMPKAMLVVREPNKDDNALEMAYSLNPYPVTRYPWGKAFAIATEKYLQAAALTSISAGKPRILSAVGDGTTAILAFPTGVVANSTAKISVFINGVLTTTNLTAATDKITFTTGSEPETTDLINVVLEQV
jgi:hypothetical protein